MKILTGSIIEIGNPFLSGGKKNGESPVDFFLKYLKGVIDMYYLVCFANF